MAADVAIHSLSSTDKNVDYLHHPNQTRQNTKVFLNLSPKRSNVSAEHNLLFL